MPKCSYCQINYVKYNGDNCIECADIPIFNMKGCHFNKKGELVKDERNIGSNLRPLITNIKTNGSITRVPKTGRTNKRYKRNSK